MPENTLTKNSYISIALAITIVVGVIAITNTLADIQARVDAHQDNPINHNFVPAGELNQRLINIENALGRVEKKLDNAI